MTESTAPKRGHNPEKCGKNCIRCQMWNDYRQKHGIKIKAGNEPVKRHKRKSKDVKPIKIKGFGKLHKDLEGDVIIPFEARPVIRLCTTCKKDCKQRDPMELLYCPFIDPLVPRKRRTKAEIETAKENENA